MFFIIFYEPAGLWQHFDSYITKKPLVSFIIAGAERFLGTGRKNLLLDLQPLANENPEVRIYKCQMNLTMKYSANNDFTIIGSQPQSIL
jgi:hypothetical protein